MGAYSRSQGTAGSPSGRYSCGDSASSSRQCSAPTLLSRALRGKGVGRDRVRRGGEGERQKWHEITCDVMGWHGTRQRVERRVGHQLVDADRDGRKYAQMVN
jgi:hypothetical protein